VRCFVGVDAGVLDDDFSLILQGRRTPPTRFFLCAFPKGSAVEVRVQVSAAGNFQSRNPRDLAEIRGNFLGDLSRRPFELFGQLKAHRRRRFAHLELGRAAEHNLNLRSIPLSDVPAERFAQSIRQCLIHGSSRPMGISRV